MKHFILMVTVNLLICPAKAKTQQYEMDELKNYSYLVSGDTILSVGKGHMQGTGFFVTRNGKTYFVCAKHTLSGCNDKNEKDFRSPNIMHIIIGNSACEANQRFGSMPITGS